MKAKRAITGPAVAMILGTAGLAAAPAVSAHDHGHVSHLRVTVEEHHHPPHGHGWRHGAWSHGWRIHHGHGPAHHAGWGHGWRGWRHPVHHGGARLGGHTGRWRHHRGHTGWAVTFYGGH